MDNSNIAIFKSSVSKSIALLQIWILLLFLFGITTLFCRPIKSQVYLPFYFETRPPYLLFFHILNIWRRANKTHISMRNTNLQPNAMHILYDEWSWMAKERKHSFIHSTREKICRLNSFAFAFHLGRSWKLIFTRKCEKRKENGIKNWRAEKRQINFIA